MKSLLLSILVIASIACIGTFAQARVKHPINLLAYLTKIDKKNVTILFRNKAYRIPKRFLLGSKLMTGRHVVVSLPQLDCKLYMKEDCPLS